MEGFASWLGVPRICRLTGLSDRAVQPALKRLQARNAIQCIYQSKGGAARKQEGKNEPAKTNCYLLTPSLVPRSLPVETQHPVPRYQHAQPRIKMPVTPNGKAENPAPSSPYNPAPRSPELLTFHHHQEERKEKPNEQLFSPSFPDDDDGRTKRRTTLEDPTAELALRFKERFGSSAEGLLRIVLDGISPKVQDIRDFLVFDDAHTGSPGDLTNPGGYYRNLTVKFQLSQSNRRERERLARQNELERRYTAPAEPAPVCPLGKCNGRGEVYHADRLVAVCECEAGQGLRPAVLETMAKLKRGAA